MSSPPPILFTVPALFHPTGGIRGGAERYVYELARHLADSHPTELISFGKPGQEQVGNLKIRLLRPFLVKKQQFNPIAPQVLFALRKSRLVHCFQKHILLSSLLAGIGKMIRKPVFVTDLGGGGWDVSAYLSTDSWFRGELHISRYSQSLGGTQPSFLIGGGVDTQKFSPDPAIKKTDFLFVGRLFPHKGVDTLIEAANERTPVHVVGTAPDAKYFAHLQQLARDKPVRFSLGASDTDLVKFYRQAKAIVLPSRRVDCFGNTTEVSELLGQTLLEGMACELPAVGSQVASIPEIVNDGETGYLFPEGDANKLREILNRIADQPERAAEVGRAGRQAVLDQFSWPAVVDRCLRAYGVKA